MFKRLLICVLLCGCASRVPSETSAQLAASAGMYAVEWPVQGFVLSGFQRIGNMSAPVRIYIEGDGHAWMTPTTPSADPTPLQATALSLAVIDPYPNVVYLARPCQYIMSRSPGCSMTYWTDKRFSEEVILVMNAAVDAISRQLPGQAVELVGYSGGAAIAVLLAARRHDVMNLRTIAGNLDTEEINRYHHVSAMPDSLNPIDVAQRLAAIPQRHFIGGRDRVVPGFIVKKFVSRIGHPACQDVVTVEDATHGVGWTKGWKELIARPMPVCDRE